MGILLSLERKKIIGWDIDLRFEEVKTRILEAYIGSEYPKKAHFAICLIQLENGSRISEALPVERNF